MSGMMRAIATTLLVLALSGLAGCAHRAAGALPWDGARQMVLVTTDGWDATTGRLQAWERRGGRWQAAGPAREVTVGRAGVAWGLGLHPTQTGLAKREGDGRAPAGVFAIGTAFGYAGEATTALPYAPMDAADWCIDVADSPLYNRIVDAGEVGDAAVAGSTEPMRRDLHAGGDTRYRLGFVIAHNPGARPGAGSCIFAHLWKAPGVATAGCTAMEEPAMQALLEWLDPAADPVFVLLPLSELERLSSDWRLPAP